jgi:hypothetical protein
MSGRVLEILGWCDNENDWIEIDDPRANIIFIVYHAGNRYITNLEKFSMLNDTSIITIEEPSEDTKVKIIKIIADHTGR